MSADAAEVVVIAVLSGIGVTVLFLMPGYLLQAAWRHGVRRPEPSDRVFATRTLTGALVVHAILLPWTVALVRQGAFGDPVDHAGAIAAWAVLGLVVVPNLVGAALARLTRMAGPAWLARLLDLLGLAHHFRVVEAWSWQFSRREPAYVRVRLKDGRTVLGYYGPRSFASFDAAHGDLYLEQQYRKGDGKIFGPPFGATSGVWISGTEIVTIEFFRGQGDRA
jgi:hypothetical protein